MSVKLGNGAANPVGERCLCRKARDEALDLARVCAKQSEVAPDVSRGKSDPLHDYIPGVPAQRCAHAVDVGPASVTAGTSVTQNFNLTSGVYMLGEFVG